MNKSYSSEEKRKILMDNYSRPNKQVDFEELKKTSTDSKTSFLTVRSLDEGCGDVLHLLIIKQDNNLKKCLFSGQQSCLITVAATNILLSFIEKKNSQSAQELMENCQKMLEKENYNLDICPEFQIFNDISQFPHRIECIRLVIRGISNLI